MSGRLSPGARRWVAPSAFAALTALAVSGCITVGPNYEQPAIQVPDAWKAAAVEGLSDGEASLQTWWTVLEDPILEDLIQRVGEASLDIELAMWRVEEARALRGIARGDRTPQVGFSGSSSRSQASDNGPIPPPDEGFEAANLHDYGVGAAWELDLWGRVRRSVESADANLQASVEDYRDVLVTVLAEVALGYTDVRSQQERLVLARANVKSQEETLKLTRDRFDAGLVSFLDVEQAQSNLSSTESVIPTLEINLELALNRIAVLLGGAPGTVDAELAEQKPLPSPPADVIVGLPADLLRQRPDVRRAERDLASQNARIGVATADLYPTFSLSGFFGLQSTSFSGLGEGDAVTWSFGLPIRWSLFSGGKVQSRIQAERTRTEQARVIYQQTVLFALEEVEGNIVAYDRERARRDKLREAVAATERSLELVLTQYRAGLADFQNVLDTQRSLLVRQDDLATSEGLVVKNLIALYRALGGGWAPEEDASS